MQYDYELDGNRHTNRSGFEWHEEKEVRWRASLFPVGATVDVYVDRTNPSEGTLTPPAGKIPGDVTMPCLLAVVVFGGTFLIVGPPAVALLGVGLVAYSWKLHREAAQVKSWTEVPGRVLASRASGSEDGGQCLSAVRYEINGVSYVGSRSQEYASEALAREAAEALTPGTEVAIW